MTTTKTVIVDAGAEDTVLSVMEELSHKIIDIDDNKEISVLFLKYGHPQEDLDINPVENSIKKTQALKIEK